MKSTWENSNDASGENSDPFWEEMQMAPPGSWQRLEWQTLRSLVRLADTTSTKSMDTYFDSLHDKIMEKIL